jgi:hypothetical protein
MLIYLQLPKALCPILAVDTVVKVKFGVSIARNDAITSPPVPVREEVDSDSLLEQVVLKNFLCSQAWLVKRMARRKRTRQNLIFI